MIRPFEAHDAARCSEIVAACVQQDPFLSHETRERIHRGVSAESVLERSRLYYLAVYELDGQPAGFGGVDMNEVRLLYVRPEFQGKGIGARLLRHLEDMVPPGLFADVFVYAALPAVGFYRQHGYRPEGEWQTDLGGELLTTMFMRKELREHS
jgi:GNAT superfamily N-acetyltransferase